MAFAAEKTPVTRPRWVWNHRFATIAPSTRAIAPVPMPMQTPHSSQSCHGCVIRVVSPLATPTTTRAAATVRRTPKRSMKAAANGAVSPYSTRLRLTAPEVTARDQPNSDSIGSSSTPVELRNAAAATSAPSVTPATTQAKCRRVRGGSPTNVPGSDVTATASH